MRIPCASGECAVGPQECLLGHFLGETAVTAETVRHIDERTLPALDNPFEGGDVSAQNLFDIGLVVCPNIVLTIGLAIGLMLAGAQVWIPPPEVRHDPIVAGCIILAPQPFEKIATGFPPWLSDRMQRRNRA
jgi:hypothetical protein